ncbi:Outer membrane receptor proteins, mostly Fe transport [Mucilaginibacter lappiensis]|uniref:Outer membrane receptor protein involved in Fe transport n=1 Tax=Mucilaginibacter lappiensis TaxID=354630 RepID=A0ABR6PQ03_9SPHI|nr:outer membrane beta-barrel family protein [Mucilaginibacter lappiensis]MBB6111819.1 outer membrane receptor protein involved in Fe transport [Mucilaginibacter lappiensis]SIR88116.1 Outer membrane receptor proteins, mostly Fe transport [Mucilaginibacter lappiensis]
MKTLTNNIFCTLLLVAISWSASFAQGGKSGGAKVSGSLLNEQGKPMDYATVSLIRATDSTVVKGALSNDNGVYTFENIRSGKYLIKASVVGYQKAVTTPFTVPESATTVTAPALSMHAGSTELKGVTITATKPLIERKIDRTVMNVENSVLAAGNTALEILAKAPGVTVDKDDNISLKGKQGVTVMINDKLTYLSAAELATLLRSTDGNTIKSIEIITNPSAKYDAAGNSGIINIKLKKNSQSGTNGSITVGAARGAFWRDNTSLNLNHKEGNLNVFGTFSRGDNKNTRDISIDRITRDSAGKPTYFNQLTRMPHVYHYNNYRIGADYDVTSKNTIGFVVSGYSNSELDNNNGSTKIGATPNRVDSSLTTVSTIDQSYKNFAANLNDRFKIDTSGQELSVDLDYSKFKNNSIAQYNTNYFLPDGSTPHAPQLLRNQTPSNITIYTAKVDYTKPISKTIKLETGAKFSSVKTDNNLQAQIFNGNSYVNDTTRTNRFIYTEKISAGYLNLNKQFKKTSIQLGLRGEYTQSNGNLLGSTPVDRSYFNLFPSAFINHTLNDKNEISFSYSRRIDRPGYDDLNPFVYYLDPYTFSKGNAFLKPQYTNNFEFNYTYNKSINVSLGYSRTTDVITEIILTEGQKSFQTNLNLQTQNSYSLNINAPYTITKWWTGNVDVNSFYLGFKSDSVGTGKLSSGQVTVQVKATQTLTFGSYRFEIRGDYQSPLTYGIYKIKPRYGVDAGVSHSFANKKANIKLALDDIFFIRRNNVSSHTLGNDFDIRQINDSRVGRLTFTYNFGNNKIKTREHKSGADDEKGRVKGAN